MKNIIDTPLLPSNELLCIEVEGVPVWSYWSEFVTHCCDYNRSDKTLLNVRDSLRLLIRHGKLYELDDYNKPLILTKVLRNLMVERNWAPITFNSHLKNINTYFIWLETYGYIKRNYIRGLDRIKQQEENLPTTKPMQYKDVLFYLLNRKNQSELEYKRNLLIFLFLGNFGMRPIELLNIRLNDIEEVNTRYRLVIRGAKQKGKPRYYWLNGMVLRSYSDYLRTLSQLTRLEDKLFVSATKKNVGLTYNGLRLIFNRISKDSGVKIAPYYLRRFVATELNKKNVSPNDIMHFMGHSRLSTTYRYIEKSCVLTDKANDAMGEILNDISIEPM